MTDADLLEIRAALIQFGKALETERACVIRLQKVIERKLKKPTTRTIVTILPQDSVTEYTTNPDNAL